jgi:hypothetical protein
LAKIIGRLKPGPQGATVARWIFAWARSLTRRRAPGRTASPCSIAELVSRFLGLASRFPWKCLDP